MALDIDTTRAFRFHDEILRLVEAVIAADGTDEAAWIEWKGLLDLRREEAFWHLPRQVLGFANREPGGVASKVEGYGYLIVGAEPGQALGITPIDPGDLSSRMRAYVGERVVWHPEYVTVGGVSVLVITVEPSRPGDPIHTLRKKMQKMEPGAILIRLLGQTVQARPEHIEMLVKRAGAGANRLDLCVATWGAACIERSADLEPLVVPHVEQMRRDLLAKVPEPLAEGWNAGHFQLAAQFAAGVEKDAKDDRAKYLGDVEVYLNRWARTIRARSDVLLAEHPAAHLSLTVKNTTDRNFLQVQVSVYVDGVFSPEKETGGWPDLPPVPGPPARRPRPPILSLATGLDLLYGVGHKWEPQSRYFLPTPALPNPAMRKSNGPGGLLLKYPQFDLRPRDEIVLDSVLLHVRDPSVAAIAVRWEATATNADGRLGGEIPLTVADSSVNLSRLFTDTPQPED